MKREVGKGRSPKKIKAEKKYKKAMKNLLPERFKVIELEVAGKKIRADMEDLLMVSNTDSEYEVIDSMNKVTSLYFYFGRVAIDLEQELDDFEEQFERFMAKKRVKFMKKESSEKGRERRVMVTYPKTYKRLKNEIKRLKMFQKYANIAYKSLDKNIEIIRSIGSMIRSGKEGSHTN